MHLFLRVGILAFSLIGIAHADALQNLLTTYQLLGDAMQQSPFQRQLLLTSNETPDQVSGNVHAVVDHPIATVIAGLNTPAQWCEVIALHPNTKFCSSESSTPRKRLTVRIGTKGPQELMQAPRLEFDFVLAASSPQYLSVMLNAKDGPMGTSNYRIALEAIPLSAGKTFLHLTYGYGVNLLGRMAMQTYLATAGRNKVGFTVVSTKPHGAPDFIGGVRGVLERNIMRYYLAIDVCLQTLGQPESEQFERRLQLWSDAIERYPRQLHELERAEYVAMKRADHLRETQPN